MRKSILLIVLAIISLSLNAQDLASIVKKYEKASGAEKLSSFKTIVMEGYMEMQGMQMQMTIKEKKPDKFKTFIEFSGMQIVTVVNGDKGYMINPGMGSGNPTPLSPEQIAQTKTGGNLNSSVSELFKKGKIELIGDATFRGVSTFKIKMNTEAGDAFAFIAKDTYLIKGMQMSVDQGGVNTEMETVMSGYKDTEGIMIAMKIDIYSAGNYLYGMEFTKVEFNSPIEDSEFEIK
jgi:outer membrane lipoprotein-sorting protein